jgi:glutamyl/glutaminyl-tRNA synthetase
MVDQSTLARTRIAPTPSGYLHLGNAFSFVVTALDAMRHGAEIILRIDDLDRDRFRDEYLEDIFHVLDFLGIEPTIGPSGPEEFHHSFSQHLRIDRYMTLVNELRNSGLVYACECSRKDFAQVAPHQYCACKRANLSFDKLGVVWRWAGELPQYTCCDHDGHCHAVMLSETPGRTVLFQRNQKPAYQIASLSDDLDFGITRIVRGADLIDSTALQLHLARCLNRNVFESVQFIHHGLVTLENVKLSKSEGATAVRWAREQGFSRAGFYTAIAHNWGLTKKKVVQLSELNDLVGEAFPACSREPLAVQRVF